MEILQRRSICAAWTPQKAVLSLRNPSAGETFEIITVREFELPPHKRMNFNSLMQNRQPKEIDNLWHKEIFNITLQPFEVKVFDVLPKK